MRIVEVEKQAPPYSWLKRFRLGAREEDSHRDRIVVDSIETGQAKVNDQGELLEFCHTEGRVRTKKNMVYPTDSSFCLIQVSKGRKKPSALARDHWRSEFVPQYAKEGEDTQKEQHPKQKMSPHCWSKECMDYGRLGS